MGRVWWFVLVIVLLASCRKDEPVAMAPQPLTTVTTSFSPNFPGAALSSTRSSDGSCFMVMESAPPYVFRELVKVGSDGELDAQFVPASIGSFQQGPVEATEDGGCISVTMDDLVMRVSRLDATGATISVQDYDVEIEEEAQAVSRTAQGTWVIAGHRQYNVQVDSNTFMLVQDLWAMAVGVSCDSLWKRRYTTPEPNWISDIIGLSNGDAFICSRHWSVQGTLLTATRIDGQGDMLWSRDIGPTGGHGPAVCETPGGNLVFVAGVPFSSNSLHGMLYATDPLGNLLWQQGFGEATADVWPRSVAASVDGQHLLVTGRFREIGGEVRDRLFVAGFDAVGSTLWERYVAFNDTVAGGLAVHPNAGSGFTVVGTGHPKYDSDIPWFTFSRSIDVAGTFY